jgi:hypothetical protein
METSKSAPAGQRPAPEPVSVRARFAGGNLADGSAILSIRDGDGESSYWCEALPAGGYRLRKFGAGRRYELPADLSGCTCGDRTHRPERPGGCKHMAALRQALPSVTKASA